VRSVIRHRNERGFSSGVGLLAMAFGLIVMAVLILVGFNTFAGGGSSGTGGTTSNSLSIVSHSSAESQIKLCAEGRDSSYGDPPSPTQQGKCASQLAGQISGGGASLSGGP
jgi:hypothetical protein